MTLANTVVTSHTVGIVRPSNSALTGDYNGFFGNSTNQQVNGSNTPLPFAHIVSVEPHFVDPIENDFHLLSNSPLIDAGDPGGAYSGHYDIDGDLIPLNGRADIGADEYSKTQVFPPSITSLKPGSIAAGSPALTLIVTGAHFANGATIVWNGSDRVTTFISNSQLEAVISEADLASARTIFVAVRNPDDSVSAVQPLIITPYTKYLPLLQRRSPLARR